MERNKTSYSNIISLNYLSYSFGDKKALKDINIKLPAGKMYGVIGSDSAGKTTLLRLIAGLMVPTVGRVETLGLDTVNNKEKLSKKIAYMPQKFGLYEDLTVQENMELFAGIKRLPKKEWEEVFRKYLTMTGLDLFRERLAGKLSGGMKQKLALCCSLLGAPSLLLLDEPSVGVDPISRRDLFNLLSETVLEGTTVVWSTAYLDEAFQFDEIIFLDKGEIIFQGNPYSLAEDLSKFENEIIKLMGGYKENKLEYRIKSNIPSVYFPVEALGLVKQYGDFFAVKNNSFHIKAGEIFGLLGPNGAGKSTSFKMMCGLTKPTAGKARIMGVDMHENSALARSFIGYMAQKFSLYSYLTVQQNLEFFAEVYGLNKTEKQVRVEDMLLQFELKEYRNSLAGSVPLGYKQRLSFAVALLHQPAVLFLDEPTSGVDPVSRNLFWQEIKSLAQKGVTVLITTHFMDEAELCDRISIFYNGESIALGNPDELKKLSGSKTMAEAFIRLIEDYNES